MSTADQLLPLIFSWIEKRERCADQLIKLARELESLREKCNAGECVGSSVAVLGAACVIGAGLATMFTGGAAAPLLGMAGAAYTGVGITVSVAAKITENFLSSDTMKEAMKIEEKSNKTAAEIQQLFDKLRAEAKAENPSADPDELDRHITSKILTSMARSGVKGEVSIGFFNDKPEIFLNGRPRWSGVNDILAASVMVGVYGVLSFFRFQLRGKKFQLLFAEGVKQLVKQMSTTAFKTALKGGAKVVGGAVGMVFVLHEAIDNWTDMIKNNHVTEASQSLRDTANSIRKATQTLRKQLDSIKQVFCEMETDEMAKCQQEQEEKKKKRNQQPGRGDPGGEKRDNEDDDIYSDEEDTFSDFSSISTCQPNNSKDEIRMGLLNVRSMTNKQPRITNLINKFNLKVLQLTETWVKEEILIKGFKVLHQQRVDEKGNPKRGGGVATLYSEDLQGVQFEDKSFKSFEYVAADLRHGKWDRPIRTVTVYRPPGENNKDIDKFLEKFQNLLNKFSKDDSILITGDFNIWVNENSATKNPQQHKFATRFKKLLKDNGLHQHVKEETHKKHNILDLVITRNVDISNLRVKKPKPKTKKRNQLTDHYAVIFSVRPTSEKHREKKTHRPDRPTERTIQRQGRINKDRRRKYRKCFSKMT